MDPFTRTDVRRCADRASKIRLWYRRRRSGGGGEEASTPSAARYFLGAACGVVVAAVAMLMLVSSLDAAGRLPAPAVTNVVCIDEKLKFLREHPQEPTLLVLGSSIAWRNVEGQSIFDATKGTIVPLNLGLCGSQINQTRFAARYFLDRYRSVSEAVLVVGITDLEDCSRPPPFEPADGDSYLNARAPEYFFYFKHFDMMSLIRNARTIHERRSDIASEESMVMDRFGSGPSLMRRALYYDGRLAVDEKCMDELRSFALELPSRIERSAVIVSPIHPEWLAQFDPTGDRVARLVERLSSAVAGTRTAVWNAHSELNLDAEFFGDAIHLRSPGAQLFAQRLGVRLGEVPRFVGSAASPAARVKP